MAAEAQRLLDRMQEMRATLVELNGRVLQADRDIEETFDRAWRMLQMRRMLAAHGDGFAVLPRARALVSYYANSIAHLLGPFEDALKWDVSETAKQPKDKAAKMAAKAGITAVIQPGGSRNDAEVIAACNQHKMAMLFTGRRHFKH